MHNNKGIAEVLGGNTRLILGAAHAIPMAKAPN